MPESDPQSRQIESLDEIEDGEYYQYGSGDVLDEYVWRADLSQYDPPEKFGLGPLITLHYKDGYVADLTPDKLEEHIEDGKVYEHN